MRIFKTRLERLKAKLVRLRAERDVRWGLIENAGTLSRLEKTVTTRRYVERYVKLCTKAAALEVLIASIEGWQNETESQEEFPNDVGIESETEAWNLEDLEVDEIALTPTKATKENERIKE